MPIPMVSQATVIGQRSDWDGLPGSFRTSPITLLFREDSFDPVTRTRRGRVYQSMTGAPYPNHQSRVMPHPFENLTRSQLGPDGRLHRPLSVYAAATSLFELPNRGLGATLALGNRLASSAWQIVDLEITVSDDVMVSLRALTSYGILPLVDPDKINERFRDDIERSMGKVLHSAFKESPTSVVDQCRDAATVIASRWIAQQTGDDAALRKDLAKVGDALPPHERRSVGRNDRSHRRRRSDAWTGHHRNQGCNLGGPPFLRGVHSAGLSPNHHFRVGVDLCVASRRRPAALALPQRPNPLSSAAEGAATTHW